MSNEVRCEWCVKEITFLHQAGEVSQKEIKAYTVYFGIFSGEPTSFRHAGIMAGYSEQETKEVIEEVVTWLTENSPFRGGHPRCFVCNHVKEAFA
jgi:hypothetical protein